MSLSSKKSAKLCTKCAQFLRTAWILSFTMIIRHAINHLYESTLDIDGKRLVIFNLAMSFPCLIRIFPDPLCRLMMGLAKWEFWMEKCIQDVRSFVFYLLDISLHLSLFTLNFVGCQWTVNCLSESDNRPLMGWSLVVISDSYSGTWTPTPL